MIDEKTGELVLESGERIPPFWPKEALMASPLGRGATERPKGQGWVDVRLPAVHTDGMTFCAIFHFHEGELAGMHLMDDDPRFGDSWETADEEGRKASHDAWLARTLGPPPYEYAWGEVGSSYDPRSDSSQIYVQFRREAP
jgi:hypothetical protein